MDLVGIYKDRTTIGELKFATATSHSDSPELALLEILIYNYFIQENLALLIERQVQHLNAIQDIPWAHFMIPTPTLMIIANHYYWEYWFNRVSHYIDGRPNRENYFDYTRSFAELNNVNIIKLSGPNIDFEAQKDGPENYNPSNGGNNILLEEIV